MPSQINLVQGDTGPDFIVGLYDSISNSPMDLSNAGTVVRLYFRREDSATVITKVGSKPNGGADGVVAFVWSTGDLDVAGNYDGEIEVTFNSGKIQTVPEKVRFVVREQIQ